MAQKKSEISALKMIGIVAGSIGLALLAYKAYQGIAKAAPDSVPNPKGAGAQRGATDTPIGEGLGLANTILKMLAGIGKGSGGTGGGGKDPGGAGGSQPGGQPGQSGQASGHGGNGSGGKPPSASDLGAIGYTEGTDGSIRGPGGELIGTRASDGGIDYVDGSHQYTNGSTWDPNNQWITYADGSIGMHDGTIIGQFNQNGDVVAVDGAIFNEDGSFGGFEYEDGRYWDYDTNEMYDNNGVYLGDSLGDGTYMNEYGDIVNEFTGEVEQYYNDEEPPADNNDGSSDGPAGDGTADYGYYDDNGDWVSISGRKKIRKPRVGFSITISGRRSKGLDKVRALR